MRRSTMIILALVVVAAVIGGGVWILRTRLLLTGKTLDPERSYVVFVESTAAGNDLYALDTESGEEVQLTQGRQVDHVALSPDGRHIALVSSGHLQAWDTESGMLTEIASNSDYSVWSPDGTRLAWYGSRDNQSGIFVTATDGGDPVYLVDGVQPAWSHDGRQLVYLREYESQQGGRGRDIDAVEIDSGQTRLVVERAGYEYAPAWSASGAHLLFQSDVGQLGIRQVVVADADGENARVVGDSGSHASSYWSPSGDIILYTTLDQNLCVVGVEIDVPTCSTYPVSEPIWSADGTQIAYVTWNAENAICIIDAPVQDAQAVSEGQCFDEHPEGTLTAVGWIS